MTPSTSGRNAPMLVDFAPVLSSTGAEPATASTTSRTASRSGSAPAIGPDTRIASASVDTTAERARVPALRVPSGDANSGVTFISTATPSAPSARRSRSSAAGSGRQRPMSLSKTPGITSRMKLAPVVAATASAQRASHR